MNTCFRDKTGNGNNRKRGGGRKISEINWTPLHVNVTYKKQCYWKLISTDII